MTSNNPTVTGIDLGSSAAKIAAILKGGVQVITNEATFRQTPNVVGLGQRQRLLGEAAQVKIKSNSANTVVAPSRFLAFQRHCPYVQEELKFCPAKPKHDEDNSALRFSLLNGQQRETFHPEQLVASYLTEMQKIIAQTNSLQNKNMVIAVPSYFTQHQRQALLDAIEITKKKTNTQYSTQLVDEQIAASMDYGFGKRNQFSEDLGNAKKVLFLDFGHSKVNAFVTAFNSQNMRIIASKHERQLGCKFMDQKLLHFYAQYFDNRNPNLDLKLFESKKATLKLLENIEKQRKVLSGNSQHDLSIECLLEDQDIFYSMKRQQFEEIIAPVINKFKKFLTDFAVELKTKNIQIQQIELVGGGTRIPAVLKVISEVFGKQPSRTINSNECIARGAALISAMNSSIFRVPNYCFFAQSPYTVVIENEQGEFLGKLLQKDEIILREKKVQLQTDLSNLNQLSLIAVYSEGQLPGGLENKLFKVDFSIENTKIESQEEVQMKEQSEQQSKVNSKIVLNIEIDQNKKINFIKAQTPEKQLKIKAKKVEYFKKFNEIQLKQFEEKQKQMTQKDLAIKKLYEKKNEFEASIYKNRDKVNQLVQQNSQYVSPTIANQIKEFFDKQEQVLYQDEQKFDKLEKYDKKIQQMNKNVEQFILRIKTLKEDYMKVNNQLEKLATFLNQTISKRNQNMYPEEVNKAGQWVNETFQKLKNQPKYQQPSVSLRQIQEIYRTVKQSLDQFDLQMQRRTRNRIPQSSFYPQRQQQKYQPYGGHSQRNRYDDDYFRPRTTRNSRKSQYDNPFGSFFGNTGFSGFF